MKHLRSFLTIFAVGLAGIFGLSCEYEDDGAIGYDAPPADVDFYEAPESPQIGQPDFPGDDADIDVDIEREEPAQATPPAQPLPENDTDFNVQVEREAQPETTAPGQTTPGQPETIEDAFEEEQTNP